MCISLTKITLEEQDKSGHIEHEDVEYMLAILFEKSGNFIPFLNCFRWSRFVILRDLKRRHARDVCRGVQEVLVRPWKILQ